MYRALTRDIEVTVEPAYCPERSDPDQSAHFWTYTIEITNLGHETVQLLSRRWMIIDAHGKRMDVAGPGVVGEQPMLGPSDSFRYTSGVPLNTTSGVMSGAYEMITDEGERFEIEVPTFSLDAPDASRTIN